MVAMLEPDNSPKDDSDLLFNLYAHILLFMCNFAGFDNGDEFKSVRIFSKVFKRHSRNELDALLTCGGPKSTPKLRDVSADPPEPWLFARLLFLGLFSLVILLFGFFWLDSVLLLPGIIFVGAFIVPLACVCFFGSIAKSVGR